MTTVPRWQPDAARLLASRSFRGFLDGCISFFLADYLTRLGLSVGEIGLVVAGTLVGSALTVILMGFVAHRVRRRAVLMAATMLMVVTGLGFAGLTGFWPLLLVAVVGTLNPSAGDVSLFLPMEQAVLAQVVPPQRRTELFAWYNVLGSLAGAAGTMAGGLPGWYAREAGGSALRAESWVFLLYAATAVVTAIFFATLSPGIEPASTGARRPLEHSRGVVVKLAALFCIDTMGGGFVVQSLLVLWLSLRFGLSDTTTATIFGISGVLNAASQLISVPIAARLGLIRTMVYTHLPANVFLILAGIATTPGAAVTFLLLRAALSSMDVPARQTYVMSVVPEEERAAASSFTNVPRSLAAAITPPVTGALLAISHFGWPLILGGSFKILYDLLLLQQFRAADIKAPPR